MKLREYQIEPIQKGINFFQKKETEPSIIVMPTAAGKSIIIAKIVETIQDKILIIQPSKELLQQNFDKYVNLGGEASIFSASFKSKEIGLVTYATIGSIKNIGSIFKEYNFKKIIIDECHAFPRDSESMLGNFLKESEITHILGLTATPFKLQQNYDINRNVFSKISMLTANSKYGNLFKKIIHVCQIQELVNNNYWAKLLYNIIDLDESNLILNSTRSEFTEDSIKQTLEVEHVLDKAVDITKNLTNRKSILIFVPSIEDALYVSQKLDNSKYVHSFTKKTERDEIVRDFKSLKLKILVNVNIFSVGFDHPELDCVMLARPTTSLSWYYQAIGRLTRIHPNKNNGLIIDLSGCVKRFGKIEEIKFSYSNIWRCYGENNKLLTGIPLHEIGNHQTENIIEQNNDDDSIEINNNITMKFGKYAGWEIRDIPESYRNWALENIIWNHSTFRIKEEMIRLKK